MLEVPDTNLWAGVNPPPVSAAIVAAPLEKALLRPALVPLLAVDAAAVAVEAVVAGGSPK